MLKQLLLKEIEYVGTGIKIESLFSTASRKIDGVTLEDVKSAIQELREQQLIRSLTPCNCTKCKTNTWYYTR